MLIKETMNYSIMNNTIMSEKLIPPVMKGQKNSRVNMSTFKNHAETFISEAAYVGKDLCKEGRMRGRMYSENNIKNALNFSDLKKKRGKEYKREKDNIYNFKTKCKSTFKVDNVKDKNTITYEIKLTPSMAEVYAESPTKELENIRESFKWNEKRERDKPLFLPWIMNSADNQQENINEEYQDATQNWSHASLKDSKSLISLTNENMNVKEYGLSNRKNILKKKGTVANSSKSQFSRRKNKMYNQYSDCPPFDPEDASLSRYIRKIKRNQKWSFVKLEKVRKSSKTVYYPKFKSRKTNLSFLPPEHQEVIHRWTEYKRGIHIFSQSAK